MKNIVDLHTHSTASDGQYTPSEIVYMAKAKGIEVLSVTDHDSDAGVGEAIRTGMSTGIRVIPGMELSAEDYLNLHILGYGFEMKHLEDFFRKRKEERDQRKYKIANYLHQRGVPIDLRDVEEYAGDGRIGRPHFAMVMLQKGFVATRKEAFDLYLDTPEFHEIDRGKPSAETCIKTIKEAGGKTSLAHPYQVVLDGNETLEELIIRLKGYGLDAVECYYPIHTREQTEEYLRLAEKHGLHITGGSDFHGEKQKPDHPLAMWELDVEWLL